MTSQILKLDGRIRLWEGTDETAEPYLELDLGGRMTPPTGQYWAVERVRMVADSADNNKLPSVQFENIRLIVIRNLGQAIVEINYTTRSYSWNSEPPPPWTSELCVVRAYPGFPIVLTAIGDTTGNTYLGILGAESCELDVTFIGTRHMATDAQGMPQP
jgi:hypothetical protein